MKQEQTKSSNKNEAAEQPDDQKDLQELFVGELADILNAERQLTKALPKMVGAAKSEELVEAFTSHLEETEDQITRLEQVFKTLGETPENKTCKAMKGLLEEGDELMKKMKDSPAIDAALIAAGQKVEHYEIASYGTVCAWAEQLGHSEVVDLLNESLEEEKAADEKLTDIAESTANQDADQVETED